MKADEEAFIENDKRKHPECDYSQQISSSCRSVNGDTTCETLKSILRLCPNQSPVEIYRNSESNSNPAGVGGMLGGLSALPFFGKEIQGLLGAFGTPGSSNDSEEVEKERRKAEKGLADFFGSVMGPLTGIVEGLIPPFDGKSHPGEAPHRLPRGHPPKNATDGDIIGEIEEV